MANLQPAIETQSERCPVRHPVMVASQALAGTGSAPRNTGGWLLAAAQRSDAAESHGLYRRTARYFSMWGREYCAGHRRTDHAAGQVV